MFIMAVVTKALAMFIMVVVMKAIGHVHYGC